MVKRELWLKKIRPFYENELIKVLIGIRRSGKSIILKQIQDELLANGVDSDHIIFINFEDLDFSFIKNETDLWQIKKDHNYVHPTQKPIALSYRAIGNHSGVQTVLDLFGGSGSTLMGCEQRQVRCFMMEYDPKYVDVIIERWKNFTGGKAVLLNGNN